MRRIRLIALAMMMLTLVWGCARPTEQKPQPGSQPVLAPQLTSKNPSTVPAGGTDQQGYLSATPASVTFLRWTEAGGNLTGQMQQVYVSAEAPLSPQTATLTIAGVKNGSSVTLTIKETGITLTGTVKGDVLTLVVPQSDGLLASVELRAGSVSAYNQAAVTFQQNVSQQAAQAAAAKAQLDQIQKAQDAVTSANASVDLALRILAEHTATLAAKTSFDSAMASYERHWTEIQARLEDVKAKGAVRPLTCYALGTVEYAVGTVEYSLGTIEYDNGSLDYVQDNIKAWVQQVNEDIQAARAAMARLDAAATANKTGTPKPAFTAMDVDAAIATAQKQVEVSLAAQKAAQAKGDDYYNKGRTVLLTAKQYLAGLTCSN